MGLRITTWNVNGIRNPFGYQPWRGKRTYNAMFDILEADIVVFQETKIQRKDLTDDMVLVPGWDSFFNLPRHKKGYSGVAIYTRQSSCVPIRAEEGITGALSPLGSSTAFNCLDSTKQIGGYPTSAQLQASTVDAVTLDSEGRAVLLEFPAFVLIGVYIPANSDGSRSDFRQSFIDILDARIRNLVSLGKRVVVAGDLNISREELDVANAEASMRKNGMDGEEYTSTPARRVLNQLLEGGKTIGTRDTGREQPVLYDVCRAFHPKRKGMFTCWEQKVNARPANCGARIDYILCSLDMKDWISEANIQEGLMGSDHCPVYAVLKEIFSYQGTEHFLRDEMNPTGMFVRGERHRDFQRNLDALPLSGRLIPEFSGRRNIKDMFSGKPSHLPSFKEASQSHSEISDKPMQAATEGAVVRTYSQMHDSTENGRSSGLEKAPSPAKRPKLSSQETKGQSNLRSFFDSSPNSGSKPTASEGIDPSKSPRFSHISRDERRGSISSPPKISNGFESSGKAVPLDQASIEISHITSPSSTSVLGSPSSTDVYDPVQSKYSWSKLFTKPISPRCEGHNEPCITLLTKKPGINLGRSFWMCPRPLGPSGAKEKNTQWRCQTFIWCSDWNARSGDSS